MIESASNGIGGEWRGDAGALAVAGGVAEGTGAAGCAAAAGAGAAGGGAGAAVPLSPASASIVAITLPCETSSPSLTRISLTMPANGAGTSIVALADSSVTRLWSLATRSPGLTITSITGTPSKSPMSGTLASRTSAIAVPLIPWSARRPVSRIWPHSSCSAGSHRDQRPMTMPRAVGHTRPTQHLSQGAPRC